jgi:digeranylgeranylglycerophospholipid reductase
MDTDWEVLVVGAGPAGCAAAMTSAGGGAKTLLIDRKKEIGTPVQCGEVVGESFIKQLKLKLPPQAIASVQDHTRFLLDRRLMIVSHESYWRSVTLERKIFDKLLAAEAAEAGASVHADTKLVSLEMDGSRVKSADLVHQGKTITVRPNIVIAADGVHSTVAKLLGTELYPDETVAKGMEYEMVAKKKLPSGMQIFLEPEVGLGYGWIIPKGPRRANVGLAILGGDKGRRSGLDEWIEGNPVVREYFDPDKVLEVKTGDAPLPGFLGGPTRGNVMFVGDAAGQTLAFVGEGILPSYACGTGAGTVAAAAATTGGLGKLKCYINAVDELMGDELSKGGELKDAILGLWNDESLPEGDRTLLCGLVMAGCVFPDEVTEARKLLELPDRAKVAQLKAAAEKRKMKVKVSGLNFR